MDTEISNKLIDTTLIILGGSTKNSDINEITNYISEIESNNPGYKYLYKTIKSVKDIFTGIDTYIAHYYITIDSNLKSE